MPTRARARIDNLTGYSSGFPSLKNIKLAQWQQWQKILVH